MLFTPTLLTLMSRLSTPASGRSSGCSMFSLRIWPREVTAMPLDLHAVVAISVTASSAITARDKSCLRLINLLSEKLFANRTPVSGDLDPVQVLAGNLDMTGLTVYDSEELHPFRAVFRFRKAKGI